MDATLIQQFSAQHPYYYAVAAFTAGAMAPKVVDFIATDGVDFVIRKGLAAQRRLLIARGASPEQIAAVQKKEAEMLARAAEDVTKDDPGT